MVKESPTCRTGLKKCIIKKDVFDREITLCKKLSKEKGGRCAWGKCKDCGVILLLYKLYKGKLIEEPSEIKKLKQKILK